MENPIIELRGITKRYGDFTAVDHLSLHLNKGEIFGLLGPNGAGKSTTILMLMGLTDPSEGSLSVCGLDATRQPIEVKQKVGYLPEDVGFYDDLSAWENLMYTAGLNRLTRAVAKARATELLESVGLSHVKDKKVVTFSKGMRQRLGLADVLLKQPEVIILDEPTTGIDPKGVAELLQVIKHLRETQHITVLFSSHNLHQVQEVCDRVCIFVEGRLLALGTIEELSHALFDSQSTLLELGIDDEQGLDAANLERVLEGIEGINHIAQSRERVELSCSRDVSSAVAQAIISANYKLNYLSKKEYGLEAIYKHYFEGGKNHA